MKILRHSSTAFIGGLCIITHRTKSTTNTLLKLAKLVFAFLVLTKHPSDEEPVLIQKHKKIAVIFQLTSLAIHARQDECVNNPIVMSHSEPMS